jgi:PRTRC genetic system ThiF family protein
MNTLTIEPTYRVLLGDVTHFCIMIVGAGGTGSTLALHLASLAFHARQKGIQVDLTLVDHDLVEMKNCGRQALSVQAALAGNVPKVADLALRLNAAYGLDVDAWPQKYESSLARKWFQDGRYGHTAAHLIMGCVDNHQGRQQIAQTLEAYNGRIWGVDCGNDLNSGQILIGNLTDLSHITLDKLGLCSGLPSPYLQEPALLEPDPEPQSHSCAERVLTDSQSLMVNRMTATIAATYVTNLVLHRQILQLGTYFCLEPTVMNARLITQKNIHAYQSETPTPTNITSDFEKEQDGHSHQTTIETALPCRNLSQMFSDAT